MNDVKLAEAPEQLTDALQSAFQADLDQDERVQAAGERIESALLKALGGEPEDVPAVKLVATVLESAADNRATDVHLDPMETRVQVRFRIDGLLHDVLGVPKQVQQMVTARLKVLSEMDIADSRHPQDGRISVKIGDRKFDIRVSSLPTERGEKMTLRLLDSTGGVPHLDELGMDPEDRGVFERTIGRVQGMTLVTGPTGSGKTTTLYAALQRINRRTGNIVTLEDPVEYHLSGINQVQINQLIDLTFASALRAAMRQDVDTILVGEIRDLETAQIAIRAAMTGHRVFSTIHANSAPDAINTLLNMQVPAFLISSALIAILAQRLVRKLCEECKEPYAADASELEQLGLPAGTDSLMRPKGCEACGGTGYLGRTAVYEVLAVSPDVQKAILERASVAEVTRIAQSEGMHTLYEKGAQKAAQGITSAEEIIRVLAF